MEINQPSGQGINELEVGITPIVGGTNGLFLYDNNGVLGEKPGGAGSDNNYTYYSAEADSAISAGQALYIKSNTHTDLADCSTTGTVMGIAQTNIASGFSGNLISQGQLTLSDWSASTGSATLSAGQTYYLGVAGAIGTSPPTSGFVVKLGKAITTTTLEISIEDKILL